MPFGIRINEQGPDALLDGINGGKAEHRYGRLC
jgi:hypothetical protein